MSDSFLSFVHNGFALSCNNTILSLALLPLYALLNVRNFPMFIICNMIFFTLYFGQNQVSTWVSSCVCGRGNNNTGNTGNGTNAETVITTVATETNHSTTVLHKPAFNQRDSQYQGPTAVESIASQNFSFTRKLFTTFLMWCVVYNVIIQLWSQSGLCAPLFSQDAGLLGASAPPYSSLAMTA